MRKITLALLLSLLAFGKLYAQTQHQNTGWFMFLNNTRFNDKWGLQFDVQLRSVDDWKYVRNTLVRPAVQYFINDHHNVALGYLWQTTYNKPDAAESTTLNEHRIFEQYIYTHKFSSIFASHRFRVEQRFIGTAGEDIFAQRFRYFFRFIQPLQKQQAAFTKGAFVALQNEVFLNVQNKKALNNSVFDQNRVYLAGGYRFSKKLDLELGYLNQAVNGANANTLNNIIQFAVYTRF
ncbi:DUF2490 domain-containing protein [Pedobacter rhizosphaerae]|uniref:DUF2490 domain-containing protein n=1 Tax=Pedobacter rhizosphaerae TaxID=390241 RepID=A0A1H9V828_9SPHI|nr:DUF2490 domain-containing protein [Pedobacter rhizosphaerae]SES17855.1 Protein of unknown function [Pedobacter rhizosphaerae]